MIFDIQRFCVHDGPGIRTTVFFKGCNLRCRWCHNPESWEMGYEIERYPDKCIGCGACARVCPVGLDRENCALCGACADACVTGAIERAGRNDTATEILQTVLRDRPFYGDEGGMTCSGGECMLQIDLLEQLLVGAKSAGIPAVVDTAGCVPWDRFERILHLTDLFLFDIKAATDDLHREMTGMGNELAIDNLRRLVHAGARVWVRIPVVPGVAARASEMRKIAELLYSIGGIERVELLNYHRLGAGKFESLGKASPMDPAAAPLSPDEMDALTGIIAGHGLPAFHN